MSCDKLVFDLSQELESSPSVFVRKDWINILDNQNQNYNANQSILDTSQLSNSNKYMSYREAYLQVPMLLTLASVGTPATTTFLPATTATSADYAVGLKNWFGNMIHSLTLDMNGTTIIQQTPFINMVNSFKLLTSLSWGDVATIGATIGFYPDDPLAFGFSAVDSVNGTGTFNNQNSILSGRPQSLVVFNQYNQGLGNEGFLKRQQYINYDAEADLDGAVGSLTYATLFTKQSAINVWKSYINTKINSTASVQGVFQISIMATIYLRHLHSFFQNIPLLKGTFFKFTMNLNNTSTVFSRTGGARTLVLASVSNAVGGVNPLMIASSAGASTTADSGGYDAFGGNNATGSSFRANISVGARCLDSTLTSITGVAEGTLGKSVMLYIPSYSFNPIFETAYLSSPVKHIEYEDVYQYQITQIASGGQINQLLTNGIANIKSVLLIPFYSEQVASNTGLPTGMPVYQSPFDPAGTGCTSPLVILNNFNVVVSGQNALYNTGRYTNDIFQNQLFGANAVNGGLVDGLTSGLFNGLGWQMEYCYHYVNVARMLPVEQSVPKSVQVVGQNQSAKAINLFAFISYGVSIDIDVLTGSRV